MVAKETVKSEREESKLVELSDTELFLNWVREGRYECSKYYSKECKEIT